MKYVCHKHDKGLLGRTPKEVALVEMIAGPVGELKGGTTMPCYTTGDMAAIKGVIASKLPGIKAFLGSKKFLAGDDVTYIDFVFFELLHFNNFITDGEILQDSTLSAYEARVRALNGIQAFFDSDFTKALAFNNKMAKIGNKAGHVAEQSDIKVHYFDFGGLGDAVRMTLHAAKVKF